MAARNSASSAVVLPVLPSALRGASVETHRLEGGID